MTAHEDAARLAVRPATEADRRWIRETLRAHWGSETLVSRGRAHEGDRLPGLLVHDPEEAGKPPMGMLLYDASGGEVEVVVLHSIREKVGVGTALLNAVGDLARGRGCRRLWLVTSNDNTPAIDFYLRRGFRIAAVHRGAVREARRLKPEIPLVGIDGIPIEDEIEMERWLVPASQ